jgi:hypothetical protein
MFGFGHRTIRAQRTVLKHVLDAELCGDWQWCRYSASMRTDNMTPYLWENGEQETDMIPRLRRIITEGAPEMKQLASTMAMEDAIRKRKGQFQSGKPSQDTEDGGGGDGVIDDEGDDGGGIGQTPWHHLVQLILT